MLGLLLCVLFYLFFFSSNKTYGFQNQFTCIYCEFVERVEVSARKVHSSLDFGGKSSMKSNITCHIAHTGVCAHSPGPYVMAVAYECNR